MRNPLKLHSTREMGGGKRSPGTLQRAEERNRKPGADTGEGPENTRVKPTGGQQEDERNHIWLNHQIIHNFHQASDSALQNCTQYAPQARLVGARRPTKEPREGPEAQETPKRWQGGISTRTRAGRAGPHRAQQRPQPGGSTGSSRCRYAGYPQINYARELTRSSVASLGLIPWDWLCSLAHCRGLSGRTSHTKSHRMGHAEDCT